MSSICFSTGKLLLTFDPTNVIGSYSAIVYGKITGLPFGLDEMVKGLMFTLDGIYFYFGEGSVLRFTESIRDVILPAGVKCSAWSNSKLNYFTIDSVGKALDPILIPTNVEYKLLTKGLDSDQKFELHGDVTCRYVSDQCVPCVSNKIDVFSQFCLTEHGKVWTSITEVLSEKQYGEAPSSAHN